MDQKTRVRLATSAAIMLVVVAVLLEFGIVRNLICTAGGVLFGYSLRRTIG